jgi:Cys-tRNA(Pro)/Cys-tRNA(Cys) deacylase
VVEKTNAMRMLEARKIPFETYTFDPDIHSAEGVAEVLGLPTHQVYKTLVVVRQQGKPLLVMVASDRELDLKQLAHAVGEKKLRMASYKEAESLTGLQVGGISALALINRGFEVYLDQAATELSQILVGAGCRGIDLMLNVEDLVRATKARVIEATADVDE